MDLTSLDWHPIEENLIAAACLDRCISIWDYRQHSKRRPATKITSNSCFASKLSWEKVDGNLLATAHDSQLKIWDRRKPNAALFIHVNGESELPLSNSDFRNARSRKILDVDFNPVIRNLVATSSADSVVRAVKVGSSGSGVGGALAANEPQVIIQMPQKRWPATKVRQAPFGRALISLVYDVTCNSRGGHDRSRGNIYHTRENNLTLWTSLGNNRSAH